MPQVGAVIPSFRDPGEWTFFYFQEGCKRVDELVSNLSYQLPSEARRQMAIKCGVNNV